MKAKRIFQTVAQDLFFLGLAVAGLMFQVEWVWNVFLFLFWFSFTAMLLFAIHIFNKEHGKGRVREYAPERLTRCVWGWWNLLTAIGTGCFIAAFGHYFMAAMWMVLWVTNEAIYDHVAKLRAEIAKETEPKK